MEKINEGDLLKQTSLSLEPNFKFTDENKSLYTNLAYYFTNNDKFDGDLDRGLLLCGTYRSGKTLAMQIFEKFCNTLNTRKRFRNYGVLDINIAFAKRGFDYLDDFSLYDNICIDDLGMDDGKISYYGQIADPTAILIYQRERLFHTGHNLTYATTNLDLIALEERFSSKIFERILEMFNIIHFDANPYKRKQ